MLKYFDESTEINVIKIKLNSIKRFPIAFHRYFRFDNAIFQSNQCNRKPFQCLQKIKTSLQNLQDQPYTGDTTDTFRVPIYPLFIKYDDKTK